MTILEQDLSDVQGWYSEAMRVIEAAKNLIEVGNAKDAWVLLARAMRADQGKIEWEDVL